MSLDFVVELLGAVLAKVFGSKNEKELHRLEPAVAAVNLVELRMMRLSDAQMKEKTAEFRKRLAAGETLDDILVEAFALVREAARRHLGERHYDVQILGGIVLHEGKIAEMVTGEGKTLVATCPAYLNALARTEGSPPASHVHVVTVNDYLARRDANWMRPVYEALGLTVGCIQSDMDSATRLIEYAADITYGTNNEFGFDYLRDNMKIDARLQVQKVRNYAIVDEVDSALIDEARTPLIISGGSEEAAQKYYDADRIAKALRARQDGRKEGWVFKTDEKDHNVTLTEEGMNAAAEALGFKSADEIYTGANMDWPHYLDNALKSNNLYDLDVDYVVKDGEVLIVDEFTGRLMPGRRWSDGLHQAVEAKEGLQIREENQTLATITFQNFFKLYKKISGMTGTAMTEAKEFMKIYKLDTMSIPPNRPLRRVGHPDVIYGSEKEKFDAVVEEIVNVHRVGRPVLVGTISIEKSEVLSAMLAKRGVDHEVLNAKHHEREAQIVARAGELGRVTVATNMAGRGTDIKLGRFTTEELVNYWRETGLAPRTLKAAGDADALQRKLERHWATLFLPEPELKKAQAGGDDAVRAALERILKRLAMPPMKVCGSVAGLGGLHIIGSERHEARRIDNQLRGRAGRQGDPGSSRFFLSLEDDLMRIFAKDWVANFLRRVGLSEGMPLESRLVSRQIMKAQLRVEEHNFGIRRRLLEYDEVMNEQRTLVYSKRQKALEGEELHEEILDMIEDSISSNVSRMLSAEAEPPKTPARRVEGLCAWVRATIGIVMRPAEVLGIALPSLRREMIESRVREQLSDALADEEIRPKYKDAFDKLDLSVAESVEKAFEGPEGRSDREIAGRLANLVRERFGVRPDETVVLNLTSERVEELTQGQLDDFPAHEVSERISRAASDSSGGNLAKLPKEAVAALIEDACRRKVEQEVYDPDGASAPHERLEALAAWIRESFHLEARAHELLDLSRGALEKLPLGELLLRDPEELLSRLRALVLEPHAAGKLRLDPEDVSAFVERSVTEAVAHHLSGEVRPPGSYEKTRSIVGWALRKFGIMVDPKLVLPDATAFVKPGDIHCERIEGVIREAVTATYLAREKEFGPEAMGQIERFIVLDVIDKKWKDHLRDMDALREGIWMRSYAQKSPRIAYKQEGYELFRDMMAAFREEVTDLVLRARPIAAPIEQELSDRWDISELGRGEVGGFGEREAQTEASERGGSDFKPAETYRRTAPRVKPNDPCPCGSGKKYKHCCMHKRLAPSGGEEKGEGKN